VSSNTVVQLEGHEELVGFPEGSKHDDDAAAMSLCLPRVLKGSPATARDGSQLGPRHPLPEDLNGRVSHVHPSVRALFDAAGESNDELPLLRALSDFFLHRVRLFTSQLHLEDFDTFEGLVVKNRGPDRVTVFGFMFRFSGGPHVFWLDLVRAPAPGTTARWTLYYDPDERTRAGRAAASTLSSIQRPEALDWRVFISNAEIAEDAEAK
jgi:hypothetical protein